ncbi:MAG: hypothetical protein [Bacteriophage sp.]|nr:MAG: hypothetical protein [Bacteriophage sp.]
MSCPACARQGAGYALCCCSLPGRQTIEALNKVFEKAGGLPSSGFFLFYPVIASFLAVFQARQNRTDYSALSDFYSGADTRKRA